LIKSAHSKFYFARFKMLLALLCLLNIQAFGQRYTKANVLDENTLLEVSITALGDIDNDGLVDILSTKPNGEIYINLQNSDGEFATALPIIYENPSTNLIFQEIELEDVDADGALDLVLFTTAFVSWSKNLGNLEFTEPVQIFAVNSLNESSQTTSHNYELKDLDNNGSVELVYSKTTFDYSSFLPAGDTIIDTLTILEFNEQGVFETKETIVTNLLSPDFPLSSGTSIFFENKIEIDDINGDGIQDVIVAYAAPNYSQILRLHYADTGELITEIQPVVEIFPEYKLYDVDKDGLKDICHKGRWLRQNQNGQFTQQEAFLNLAVEELLHIDWDQDGITDLISLTDAQSTMNVWFSKNIGNLEFEERELLCSHPDIELVGVSPSQSAGILFGVQSGGFNLLKNINGEVQEIPLDSRGVFTLTSLCLVDLENDGALDIVCSKKAGQGLIYYKNLGPFEYGEQTIIPNAPEGLSKIKSFDLNDDGLLDLIYSGDYKLGFMLNNGDTTFSDPIEITSDNKVSTFEFGSFFQSSGMDLVVGTEERIDIYYNFVHGQGFENMTTLYSDVQYNQDWLKIKDLDNDGDSDIVFKRDSLAWFNNNGDDFILEALPISSELSIIVRDHDADGDLDIYALDSWPHSFIYENIGDASLFEPIIEKVRASSNIPIHEVLDLDGDLIPDLISIGGSRPPRYARKLPHGEYQQSANLFASSYGDYAESFFIDLDGDGDLDLISAIPSLESVRIDEHMAGIPQVDFSWQVYPGNSCTYDTVLFVNHSASYFPNSTITWNFGDAHFTQDVHPTRTFAEPGMYDVYLSICNETGCNSTLKTLALTDPFYTSPNFGIPTTGFVGDPIMFTDETQLVDSWSWIFGDGEVSLEQSPTHVYTEPGTYTVELILTNSTVVDCTFSITQTIQIAAVSGIGDETFGSISIRPNPFFENLEISGLAEGNYIYSLYDSKGTQCSKGSVSEGNIALPAELSQGIYFLEVLGVDGFRFAQQVVK